MRARPTTKKGRKSRKLWQMPNPVGRPRRFKTPEQMFEEVIEYFEWLEENPLWEEKVFHNAGEITRTRVGKMHVATMDGMQMYLGITCEGWREYRKRPEYSEVIREAERMIKHQKFAGASAELLNPNIIARDLGLADNNKVSASIHLHFDEEDRDA